MKKKKAIVLFSGGLDSTTCLYWALNKGYECHALTVSYGQRHKREIKSARKIAKLAGVKLTQIEMSLPWLKKSSLVNKNLKIPNLSLSKIASGRVPSTYVPGRNLMFTAFSASLADAEKADAIITGPNVMDYSGYPDCRPEFYKPLEKAVNLGTTLKNFKILTPLIKLTKSEIVKLAVKLKVPLEYTWSCYAGSVKPCGKCDSCKLRLKGFNEAGYKDPIVSS
jgi:7-cyano-7-deazaguanine synthase